MTVKHPPSRSEFLGALEALGRGGRVIGADRLQEKREVILLLAVVVGSQEFHNGLKERGVLRGACIVRL